MEASSSQAEGAYAQTKVSSVQTKVLCTQNEYSFPQAKVSSTQTKDLSIKTKAFLTTSTITEVSSPQNKASSTKLSFSCRAFKGFLSPKSGLLPPNLRLLMWNWEQDIFFLSKVRFLSPKLGLYLPNWGFCHPNLSFFHQNQLHQINPNQSANHLSNHMILPRKLKLLLPNEDIFFYQTGTFSIETWAFSVETKPRHFVHHFFYQSSTRFFEVYWPQNKVPFAQTKMSFTKLRLLMPKVKPLPKQETPFINQN